MESAVILGLMSGTSLDGLDLCLTQFELVEGAYEFEILKADSVPYSAIWQDRLRNATALLGEDLQRLNVDLGNYKGRLVNEFLKTAPIQPNYIASHGHTVFHQPENGFTLQIGDGYALHSLTNIPVIYNGDWVEHSPLAKAEWIKFFGVLYNRAQKADSIFKSIEKNYLEAKSLASNAQNKPSVLSGAMHKDIWYLPNGTSTEAQILKDANVNYLWNETEGTGSISLNFEVVFERAKNAEIWINPSYYTSYEALEKANQHYTKFDAFKNNTIYTIANTTGKTGGVLYYELGIARPDLVLKDIIKICHPELLNNYKPYFFKPLD